LPASTRVIPLVGSGLDRAAHHRRDAAWLDRAFAADNVQILLMKDGLPLVEGSGSPTQLQAVGQAIPPGRPLLWLGAQAAMLAPRALRLFLGETTKGETRRGAPVFALDLPSSFNLASSPIAGLGVFEDFRVAASGMGAFDGGAAATARALFEWHRRHGHCSVCGTKTDVQEAGWKRKCPDCDAEHFPRTDPVVIMLVVKGDKALMGRQAAWRPGFWSCLAGFVEPGETLEQAAAREVLEESGIRCSGVADYLFCQPWPFPSSLMVGMILEAETDEVTVDATELESARWFTRDEVAAMMAGRHPDAFGPAPIAIAHHVVMAWLERG
jgi:NAD+ diphosphatase